MKAAAKFKRGDIVRNTADSERSLFLFDRIEPGGGGGDWAQIVAITEPMPDGPSDDEACPPERLVRPSVTELRKALLDLQRQIDKLQRAYQVVDAEIDRRAR